MYMLEPLFSIFNANIYFYLIRNKLFVMLFNIIKACNLF